MNWKRHLPGVGGFVLAVVGSIALYVHLQMNPDAQNGIALMFVMPVIGFVAAVIGLVAGLIQVAGQGDGHWAMATGRLAIWFFATLSIAFWPWLILAVL